METVPNQNFESQPQEEKMPWTELDIETAEDMLLASQRYDQNIMWVGRMTKAARTMGFDGYLDPKLEGVRKYISQKGGLAANDEKELKEFIESERLRLCKEAAEDPDRAKFIAVGESHD